VNLPPEISVEEAATRLVDAYGGAGSDPDYWDDLVTRRAGWEHGQAILVTNPIGDAARTWAKARIARTYQPDPSLVARAEAERRVERQRERASAWFWFLVVFGWPIPLAVLYAIGGTSLALGGGLVGFLGLVLIAHRKPSPGGRDARDALYREGRARETELTAAVLRRTVALYESRLRDQGRSETPWTPAGPMPEPRESITSIGAESLAAEWMRYLGVARCPTDRGIPR